MNRTKPPRDSFVKLNSDDTHKASTGLVIAGGLLRGSNGKYAKYIGGFNGEVRRVESLRLSG